MLFQNCCIQQLPQILCRVFGYQSFGSEFLVLLKGVAEFLNDFTGEEPGFHLQFFRSFLSVGLWQRRFESKSRSAEVTGPPHRKTGAAQRSSVRRTSETARPRAEHCSSSQGEILRCGTACICNVAVAQAEKLKSSQLPPEHPFH